MITTTWFRLDNETWVNPCMITITNSSNWEVTLHLPDGTKRVIKGKDAMAVIDWLMDRDYDLRPETEREIE